MLTRIGTQTGLNLNTCAYLQDIDTCLLMSKSGSVMVSTGSQK